MQAANGICGSTLRSFIVAAIGSPPVSTITSINTSSPGDPAAEPMTIAGLLVGVGVGVGLSAPTISTWPSRQEGSMAEASGRAACKLRQARERIPPEASARMLALHV